MSTFLAYLKLLPAIIDAVIAIERAVPLPGQGPAKLDLILALIQQLSAEIRDVPIASLTATVKNVVATVVAFLNAVGVLKKGA